MSPAQRRESALEILPSFRLVQTGHSLVGSVPATCAVEAVAADLCLLLMKNVTTQPVIKAAIGMPTPSPTFSAVESSEPVEELELLDVVIAPTGDVVVSGALVCVVVKDGMLGDGAIDNDWVSVGLDEELELDDSGRAVVMLPWSSRNTPLPDWQH
ncbi:uncharacterized protein E0L32_000435 [Thyridium curvatum]|uniref:Uncharacterized protein n=1 Tax=Thyridium curvatum TaxID=1093900 RepID=A0A507BAE7_9PEZI|nr:uncharacterized protein E0L32_000435 [Thyridium curvatum]TPX14041.1 hypothetical protein E0L32_000435 [Thyridium curvatum]